MLEKIKNIPGLDATQDFELFDDTSPTALQVKFLVVSEEMPFLSKHEGRTIRKNFIHIHKRKHLGATEWQRRIYDEYRFDEPTGKWIVTKLGHPQSDIREFPEAWTAFYNGNSNDIVGTPLELLFKNDPAKVEHYKSKGFTVCEQFEHIGDVEFQGLGMSAREDTHKCKMYLKKLREQAPALAIQAKLEEKDFQITCLQTQLSELSSKLTQLLGQKIASGEFVPPKNKGGRPKGYSPQKAAQALQQNATLQPVMPVIGLIDPEGV